MVADIAIYEPWAARRKSIASSEEGSASIGLDCQDVEIFGRSEILNLSAQYFEEERLEAIYALHRHKGRLVRPASKVVEFKAESAALGSVMSVKSKFDQLIVPLMTVMALFSSALAIYKGFVNSSIAFETALFIAPGIIFLAAIYTISKADEK